MQIDPNTILPTILDSATSAPWWVYIALPLVATNYHRVFGTGFFKKAGGVVFTLLLMAAAFFAVGSFDLHPSTIHGEWFMALWGVMTVSLVSNFRGANRHYVESGRDGNQDFRFPIVILSGIAWFATAIVASSYDRAHWTEKLRSHVATFDVSVEEDGRREVYMGVLGTQHLYGDGHDFALICCDSEGNEHEICVHDHEEDKVAVIREARTYRKAHHRSKIVVKVEMIRNMRSLNDEFRYGSFEIVEKISN